MAKLKIGNVTLEHGLCLAPLAGVSDRTFRAVSRRFGAEYTVSEMVSAKALCFEQECKKQPTEQRIKTAPLASVMRDEYPMAVQIFGSEPEYMARAASMLESGEYLGACGEIPPAAIDINMGCPMAKIVGNGEGSALMRDPERAEEIVRAVVRAVSLPVTVKIRAGWDAEHINAPELAKRLEAAGAQMICVHGRTRQQMYAPSADWGVIGAVKRAVSIPVVGNGDVFSAKDALKMMAETDCDGVMIARGAQGNPWIFEEIRCAMDGIPYRLPTIDDRVAMALWHTEELMRRKGERVGIAEARKHLGWYIVGVHGAASLRDRLMRAESMSEVRELLSTLEN